MTKKFKNSLGIDPIGGNSSEISDLLRSASRKEAISQGWGDEWDQALQTAEMWAQHKSRRIIKIRAGRV